MSIDALAHATAFGVSAEDAAAIFIEPYFPLWISEYTRVVMAVVGILELVAADDILYHHM